MRIGMIVGQRTLVIAVLAVLLTGPRTVAQVPQSMRTFVDPRYGFSVRYPATWTVERSADPKAPVTFVDRETLTLTSVSSIANVSAELGDAAARAFVAGIVQEFITAGVWARAELLWEDRPNFPTLSGYYALFRITGSRGTDFFTLVYYLRDDGTGRALPPGQVTRATMLFQTPERHYKALEPTFHSMASSLRFLPPQPQDELRIVPGERFGRWTLDHGLADFVKVLGAATFVGPARKAGFLNYCWEPPELCILVERANSALMTINTSNSSARIDDVLRMRVHERVVVSALGNAPWTWKRDDNSTHWLVYDSLGVAFIVNDGPELSVGIVYAISVFRKGTASKFLPVP